MNRFSSALAFCIALPLLATPLAAQPGNPPGQQQSGMDDLRGALRLRPDQDQAWRAFQQANAPDPREEARHRDAFARMERLKAPQRMDLSIDLMRSDLADMQRRAGALKAFYSALSPEQQAIFDRETAPQQEQER